VRLLLDTHTFLWWITDSDRLPPNARDLIADGANPVFFSAASAWEIVVKAGLGRIDLPAEPERFIFEQIGTNNFEVLPIHLRHALGLLTLPEIHRDPFDRMLISQAIAEDMALVTGNSQIGRYPVRVVW
jgi:PIN domain nuclease of toxin-antitoxin system